MPNIYIQIYTPSSVQTTHYIVNQRQNLSRNKAYSKYAKQIANIETRTHAKQSNVGTVPYVMRQLVKWSAQPSLQKHISEHGGTD